MANANLNKYIALYLAPVSVIEDWMKSDPETRKVGEQKMRAEWQQWAGQHANMILGTEAGGKTKRVSPGGVADVKNDIMLYSFIEADSHEAAAKAFENHPHLQIPQSTIEIMEVRALGAM
jgi:hypothetical protein